MRTDEKYEYYFSKKSFDESIEHNKDSMGHVGDEVRYQTVRVNEEKSIGYTDRVKKGDEERKKKLNKDAVFIGEMYDSDSKTHEQVLHPTHLADIGRDIKDFTGISVIDEKDMRPIKKETLSEKLAKAKTKVNAKMQENLATLGFNKDNKKESSREL